MYLYVDTYICIYIFLLFSCSLVSNSFQPMDYFLAAATAAKSLQSCPTLYNPIDGSPPGSPVPRILQARTLELVAISFSNAWKWKVKVKSLSRVQLIATPWTAAYQAPPSMGFSRQEYWSGVPSPSPLPSWQASLSFTVSQSLLKLTSIKLITWVFHVTGRLFIVSAIRSCIYIHIYIHIYDIYV